MIFSVCRDEWENDVRNLLMAFFPGEAMQRIDNDPAAFLRVSEAGGLVTLTAAGQEERSFPVEREKKPARDEMKRQVYRLLSACTGKELPWGTLTGIRPTKLPRMLLDAGAAEAECRRVLQEEMLCGEEKTKLSIEIAKRERELLSRLDAADGYSLYIGIPFCPSICAYCSFSSNPIHLFRNRVEEYLDTLVKEIGYVAEAFQDRKLNTVYFGGGTPTSIEADELERLLSTVEERFDLSSMFEWTVEAGRPDSITREKLRAIRRHAVTRISINPQTMKQATLDLIGRQHTVEQVKAAFALAREEGFDNINMDMIVGLPDETKEDVADTLAQISALGPDNLTVHSLAIKRAARLSTSREEFAGHTSVNTDAIMGMAEAAARDMGMAPYYLYRQKNMSGNMENVGYALPGKEGVYNILIMEEIQSIVALGAGGISKRVYPDGLITRCANVKDVGQYISRIDEMTERKKELFR